jgi:hypothetical protein
MNTPKSNDLPKSLHTITAIARVARFIHAEGRHTKEEAIRDAVEVLGYATAGDPHKLAEKALGTLTRELA